jgi:hypothetical protein
MSRGMGGTGTAVQGEQSRGISSNAVRTAAVSMVVVARAAVLAAVWLLLGRAWFGCMLAAACISRSPLDSHLPVHQHQSCPCGIEDVGVDHKCIASEGPAAYGATGGRVKAGRPVRLLHSPAQHHSTAAATPPSFQHWQEPAHKRPCMLLTWPCRTPAAASSPP